jgi:hypothetical protein
LTNNHDHIVYSNLAAKILLNQKKTLEGMKFADIYQHMPQALMEATANKQDGLITEKLNDETIVYHLNSQSFSLNKQQHHLYLYKNLRMLPEMLDTTSRRSAHLHKFIEQYAHFARLPQPNKSVVELIPFIQTITQLCAVEAVTRFEAHTLLFDTAKIDKVLINIIKTPNNQAQR